MGEGMYEVVQIREIVHEIGRFGGIMRLLFVAEKTSPEGSETIAMTSEFEWQKHHDQKMQDEVERARRTLHRQVLQALLKEGWEPIGADSTGRVMALRRRIPEPPIGEGEIEPPLSERETEPFCWELNRSWRPN